jgi:hypothetical protein
MLDEGTALSMSTRGDSMISIPAGLEEVVSKPVATLIVTPDPRERRFIGEALLAGAMVYVLQKYCEGFLKGLGIIDLAESHGKRAAELLRTLRSDQDPQPAIESATADLAASVELVRTRHDAGEARASAEQELARTLASHGALPEQAREIAAGVTWVLVEHED